MMTLTHLSAHGVTFKMDIMQAALAIVKQIEKIDKKLTDGTPLSAQQRAALQAQHAVLVVLLNAVLAQL